MGHQLCFMQFTIDEFLNFTVDQFIPFVVNPSDFYTTTFYVLVQDLFANLSPSVIAQLQKQQLYESSQMNSIGITDSTSALSKTNILSDVSKGMLQQLTNLPRSQDLENTITADVSIQNLNNLSGQSINELFNKQKQLQAGEINE